KMKTFIVYGSGTNVGKTFVTSSLCRNLANSGKKVFAIKPVISGFISSDINNDLSVLARSIGYKDSFEDLALYKLTNPLSPNIAASREGIEVSFDKIIEFCKNKISQKRLEGYEYFFIETAGGFMSPICDDKTCIDVSKHIKAQSIFVASNYLGCISHTLSAFDCFDFEWFIFNPFPYDDYCGEVLGTINTFMPS
ncbi:dethiobiotin synthase, partial [bacterium]|nr:dethiobiotin synthase [bacterium]